MFDRILKAKSADEGVLRWAPAKRPSRALAMFRNIARRKMLSASMIMIAACGALWFLFYGVDLINDLYRQSHLHAYRMKFGHDPYDWDMVPERILPDLAVWAHVYASVVLLLAGQAIRAVLVRHK